MLDYGDDKQNVYSIGIEDSIIGTSFRLFQICNDSIRNSDFNIDILKKQIISTEYADTIFNLVSLLNRNPVYGSYLYVVADYTDNNWLLPHSALAYKGLFKESAKSVELNNTKESITFRRIQELNSSDIQTSKQESLFAYGKRRWFLFENLLIDTEPIALYFPLIKSPYELYHPSIASAHDISRLSLWINFQVDTLTSLTISFLPLADVGDIYPTPDYKDSRCIRYTDAEKIAVLIKNGMNVYINFPLTESLQDTRNYIISAFITLFLTLLATQLYEIVKKLIVSNHFQIQSYEELIRKRPHTKKLVIRKFQIRGMWLLIIIGLLIVIWNPNGWNYRGILWFGLLWIWVITIGVRYWVFKKFGVITKYGRIIDSGFKNEVIRLNLSTLIIWVITIILSILIATGT